MQSLSLLKQFSAIRFWHIWFAFFCLKLLSMLPLPLLYLFGLLGGELAYWLHRPRRDVTRRNLSACFPNKRSTEINALARRHFRMLAVAAFTAGIAWWGSKRRLDRLTRFQNRAIFERARSRGDNLIILSSHFVGLEYGGLYLSSLAPTISMYKHHKNPLLDALVKQCRTRFNPTQFTKKKPVKAMLNLIRNGHQFYYLPDQNPGPNRGVFVPFYGIPTATFPFLGRITALTDATVIPCMTKILPWGRGFEIIFEPPLSDFPCGDDIRDTTTMNRAIEGLIAHAPAQYFWSHKRFKTRPKGEPPFYDK